jgi:hypothetical protein
VEPEVAHQCGLQFDIHTSSALRRTHYAMIDLIWSPCENVDLGIEALHGLRENNDRQSGTPRRHGKPDSDQQHLLILMSSVTP